MQTSRDLWHNREIFIHFYSSIFIYIYICLFVALEKVTGLPSFTNEWLFRHFLRTQHYSFGHISMVNDDANCIDSIVGHNTSPGGKGENIKMRGTKKQQQY